MKRKICVVTGSRAEYGLLKYLMKKIDEYSGFELQLIVTGSHLSEQFGTTQNEIVSDGFSIDAKISILNERIEDNSTASSMSRALVGFDSVFQDLKPDLVLLLGDRSEIMSSAIAAQLNRIPIAHLHGGESTEAMLDEAFRHSITKMSHVHFVAAEEYRKRVIQLGERPESVHLVGGLGVDALIQTPLLAKHEIEERLKLKFEGKSLLITFHPVTLESSTDI
jgi:GDP/UDP-N,N'-diacetylbacillosamine 2-epimerase (hydrolysing)